jgi:beta-galactosidase
MIRTILLALILPASIQALTANARETVSFDEGWRFARFGLMPDGTCTAEPGTEAPLIRISASSEEIGADRAHTALKVLDGDRDSRWCASSATGGQWLELDLGANSDISKAAITWEEDSPAYQAVIEGRKGGGEWQPIPGSIRYLRVRVTAVPPGKWASIRELVLTDNAGHAIKNKMVKQPGDPKTADFNDSAWRKLDLPHDWAIEGPFRADLEGATGKLPWQGIGWYRKHFKTPADAAEYRWFLDFDGAMANAQVFCNGKLAGGWPYGYASFRVDLTPHLKPGADNLIAVRLDTENWGSRWYTGAGIYRNVRLTRVAPVHIGHWGVFVTTPEVSADKAKVQVAIDLENQGTAVAKAVVQTEIYQLGTKGGTEAKVATLREINTDIAPRHTATVYPHGVVEKPKLWDLATPHLHIARTTVSVGSKVVDTYDQAFGIRSIEFTPRDGFKLNGKRVPLNGVCMHHDLGALGAAVNQRAIDRQFEILREMGCNAIRTSHNPPAPGVLDAADRLGFLVIDEAFDCWSQSKAKGGKDYARLYQEWREKDLAMLIRRDRNHPSVILWSSGNEIPEQHSPAKFHLFKEMTDIIHKYDTTRPATCGISLPKETAFSGVELNVDVHGMNYAAGVYGGPDLYGKFLEKPGHEKLAGYSSESASTISSRGEYHAMQPWQVDSYDLRQPGWGGLPDQEWAALDKYPAILGEFVWTGFDYLGEPTPFNSDSTNLLNVHNDPAELERMKAELERIAKSRTTARSSYFGIVDLAGFPKDRFYLYQSRWRPDFPMAHILPHWNWPDRVGKVTPVFVYTSGDEAELFLNGKLLGKQKKQPFTYRLRWNEVKYEPGELKVVAWKDGKPWANSTVKTTGPAAKLAMTPDRARIKGDGSDLSFITVRVTDIEGITVPRSNPQLRFSIDGPGKIIATDNGDATSFTPFQSPDRKAFNGMALVIVRADKGVIGKITVQAQGQGLTESSTTIQVGP